ncbi:chemotaxis response regulator protein-glutamate methylesterase [bacterium]|nr:chemotaxis response regulator protein-glutamate methylesterase [bacterium]
MTDTLKVLIADDSIVYRKLLSDIINQHNDIELIGVAPHGGIALSKIELKKPDLVLLDIAMPEMDGLEIMKIIKQKYANTDVIFISGMNRENAEITVKALEMGALDFIPKPQTDSPQNSIKELTSALTPLLNLAKTRKYTRQAKNPSLRPIDSDKEGKTLFDREKPTVLKTVLKERTTTLKLAEKREIPKIDVIAIGVSTGGPNALNRIIPQLQADLPTPIFVVQHMPPTFTASLAERLNSISGITVVEAQAEMIIENATVYIAPGGRHMIVRKDSSGKFAIGITDSAPVHNCRPSVDVLFRSLAMIYGKNILSVILTGMGSDGTLGVAAIRRQGGYCLIQDEASSVVWGMPGAVMEAGDADEILDLDLLSKRINDVVARSC